MATAVPDERTDGQLLRAHLDGDPAAFPLLVTRHRNRLWAVALRTLGDAEEAADALQDALLSAYRNADRFRGESEVTTWLHRIVVNACLDRVRRRAARPTVPLPDDPGPPSRSADPDIRMDVQAALATLPVEQRAALVLVDMYGYPVADAAGILGVAVGTVKSRCARGRARLAAHLGYLRNPAGGSGVPSETGASGDGTAATDDHGTAPTWASGASGDGTAPTGDHGTVGGGSGGSMGGERR